VTTINWFSPVPPTRSSIAMDTATVLPALAGRAKVVAWTHEKSWSRSLETHADVRHYDPDAIPWQAINAADVTVYHVGNEPRYHGPIWQVQRRHPGIVVLHDLNLQELFLGSVSTTSVSPSEYVRTMHRHHGLRGRELAKALLTGTMRVADVAAEAPLTGAAIQNALSVIVHTQAGRDAIARTTDRRVHYVPLFVPPSTISSGASSERKRDRPPYQIIIFGFLGLNRRLESIFKALQQFPQRDQFRVHIYGTVANERAMKRLVHDLHLKRLVTFHGFAADAELDQALSRSDVALNLRDPTMGEVSASQLRIWQCGLPSLVTDIGWYATLPRETVAPVRREAELEDIQAHLAAFLAQPVTYRQMGENGRRYVREHHTIKAYVDAFMEIIDQTINARACEAVRWISARAGEAMSPWFDEADGDVLLPGVARAVAEVFDEREGQALSARE
jgi:glycosyltransferase involved in cell wall biosynthesis